MRILALIAAATVAVFILPIEEVGASWEYSSRQED
jgi:hypothetical protein